MGAAEALESAHLPFETASDRGIAQPLHGADVVDQRADLTRERLPVRHASVEGATGLVDEAGRRVDDRGHALARLRSAAGGSR